MGANWARTLRDHPDVELSAWVDIVPGLAERAAADLEISGCRFDTDLGKALTEVRPDFVVDVTIPEAHKDVTLAALSAGVPVLGEKPMSDSMKHAREMVAASERAGTLYMVSQSRRYNALLQAYRDLIVKHLGGALGILNADFYIGAHFGGFRDAMPSPLLLDMAIHTFDEARYLSGADPIAVYCEEFNPSWSWYAGDACATAVFEMTGGLRFTYRGAWCAEGAHTSWDADWRAVGKNGTAIWNGTDAPYAEVVTGTGGFHSVTRRLEGAPDPGFVGGIEGSLRDFLAALTTGHRPMVECHDNIKSLGMVFAAIESAAMGRRIYVERV
jgi:predicted dehydrogenase